MFYTGELGAAVIRTNSALAATVVLYWTTGVLLLLVVDTVSIVLSNKIYCCVYRVHRTQCFCRIVKVEI